MKDLKKLNTAYWIIWCVTIIATVMQFKLNMYETSSTILAYGSEKPYVISSSIINLVSIIPGIITVILIVRLNELIKSKTNSSNTKKVKSIKNWAIASVILFVIQYIYIIKSMFVLGDTNDLGIRLLVLLFETIAFFVTYTKLSILVLNKRKLEKTTQNLV